MSSLPEATSRTRALSFPSLPRSAAAQLALAVPAVLLAISHGGSAGQQLTLIQTRAYNTGDVIVSDSRAPG